MAADQIDIFMAAISSQESGGNPNATNPSSGAHGEYQIMPSNWGPWAEEAGIGADAPQTPENQYIVARHKMLEYYDNYGSWEAVAVAWFAGPSRAERYVNGDTSVLGLSDGNMTVGGYIDKMRQGMADLAGEDVSSPYPTGGDVQAAATTEPEPLPSGQEDELLFNMFNAVAEALRATPNRPWDADESGLATGMGWGQSEQQAQDIAGDMPTPPTPEETMEDVAIATGEAADVGTDAGKAVGGIGSTLGEAVGEWTPDRIYDWAESVVAAFPGSRVSSHTRSEEENARVGGAPNSDHLWGGGIDFGGERAAEERIYAALKPLEGNGIIRLVLDEGDHIHVSFERGASGALPTFG